MAKKKKIVVKYSGEMPTDNIAKAIIPETATSHLTGRKIGFNHRHLDQIKTGINVVVPDGYRMCFDLVDSLADRGMVALNGRKGTTTGEIVVTILNSGREIVEIRHGDPIAVLWLEQVIDFNWEA